MINVNIDLEGFEGLIGRIELTREYLTEKGVQQYFRLLLGDGDISIESTLKNNIRDLVYNSPIEMIVGDEYREQDKPNFYERTERLINSTKTRIEGNRILLFMDDNQLGTRGNLHDLSQGTATNLSDAPYSLRVENDFLYENNFGVDVLRKGSKYMEKTYMEIKHDIFNGRKHPRAIFTPIRGMWSG